MELIFLKTKPEGKGELHAKSWNHFSQRVNPAIYKVSVITDEKRLFDLSVEKNSEIFESIKENNLPILCKKLQKLHEQGKLKKTKIKKESIDGLIFNMWNKIVVDRPIDVIRKKEYYPTIDEQKCNIFSRVANVYVLCVRSKNCITNAIKI